LLVIGICSPVQAWGWSLPSFDYEWDTVKIPDFSWPISIPIASFGFGSADIVITVTNPEVSYEEATIRISAGEVSVSPGVSLGQLGVKIVSIDGGIALVVYDPSVEIKVTSGGITYTLSFSKTWFGTYNINVKVFGVTVAVIPLPSYGYTWSGQKVTGVIGFG
jgi:hypothetical protein